MSFTVYSKKSCPYCDKIKNVLSDLSIKKGYSINYYELGSDFDRQEFYEKFGEGSTFPQVMYNEEKLGGCLDTINYLMEQKMF